MKRAIDNITTARNEIKITSTFFNPVGNFLSTVCKFLALIKGKFDLIFILTEILHHSQLAFYGRALLPIPQENSLFVERASSPLLTLVQDVSINRYLHLKTKNRSTSPVIIVEQASCLFKTSCSGDI